MNACKGLWPKKRLINSWILNLSWDVFSSSHPILKLILGQVFTTSCCPREVAHTDTQSWWLGIYVCIYVYASMQETCYSYWDPWNIRSDWHIVYHYSDFIQAAWHLRFPGTLATNFSEIIIEILTFSFKKMHLKVSSAKWWPFCLGLNVLTRIYWYIWHSQRWPCIFAPKT